MGIGAQGTGRGAAPIFELDRGCVSFGADSQLLVPAEALVAVCKAAGAGAALALGRSIGEAAGRRLASRLGNDQAAFFAEAIDALGAEIGWLGLGLLVGERWGRALVLRIDGGPLELGGDQDAAATTEALLSGIFEGALGTWTGRPARAVIIDRTAGRLRVLIGGERAAAMARELALGGADHHEVLRELHRAQARAGARPGSPR